MLKVYPDYTINLIIEIFQGLAIKWDSTTLTKDKFFLENTHLPIIVHTNNG
jgi:hypothetical protein